MKRLLILFSAALILLPQLSAQKKTLKQLDAYFQQSLENWGVPGMAVAIVKDGEIILEKGYGLSNVDTGAPVDEHTLFAIASNSKAFTATSLAMLVDEGKLKWDDKVRDHLPWFELYDPYVSSEMTIRDLLCHRSGLATFSGDLLWYGSSHSAEEVVRRAKHLEPAMGFRAGYGYQNIMFIAAGLVLEEVSGQSWQDFVQERILDPLDMSRTLTSVKDLAGNTNIAAPHNSNEIGTGNHTIDWVNWDNVAPAGALISSVHDVSQWLQLQLDNGMKDSTELWSPRQNLEIRHLHNPEYVSGWSRENYKGMTMKGYGLGWEMFNYKGITAYGHGGGYDGMISYSGFIPEENLGFVILTNNINWLPSVLRYSIMDAFIEGADPNDRDWSGFFHEFKLNREKAEKEAAQKAEADRNKTSEHSLPLEAYAGTYRSEMYGDITLRVIGDEMAFQFEPTPIFRGTMRHWQYDTFQLNWGTDMMLPSGTVQFILNPSGSVEEMRIDVPNPDFDFTELKLFKLRGE